MSLEWSDTLVAAIIALLRDGLPAALQTIERDRADGIVLEPPAEYWACDKVQVQSTPAVEVWCPDSSRRNPDASDFDYAHRVVVVWTVAGTDEESLDRQLKRSLLATLRVLDGQLAAGRPLTAGNFTYLLVEAGDDERPFARSGALELDAGTITDMAIG